MEFTPHTSARKRAAQINIPTDMADQSAALVMPPDQFQATVGKHHHSAAAQRVLLSKAEHLIDRRSADSFLTDLDDACLEN